MIRHTVLLAFEGADDAVIGTVVSELRTLPALIPEISAYTSAWATARRPSSSAPTSPPSTTTAPTPRTPSTFG